MLIWFAVLYWIDSTLSFFYEIHFIILLEESVLFIAITHVNYKRYFLFALFWMKLIFSRLVQEDLASFKKKLIYPFILHLRV